MQPEAQKEEPKDEQLPINIDSTIQGLHKVFRYENIQINLILVGGYFFIESVRPLNMIKFRQAKFDPDTLFTDYKIEPKKDRGVGYIG